MGSSAELGYKGPKPYPELPHELHVDLSRGFQTMIKNSGDFMANFQNAVYRMVDDDFDGNSVTQMLLNNGALYHRIKGDHSNRLLHPKQTVPVTITEPITTAEGKVCYGEFNLHSQIQGELVAIAGMRPVINQDDEFVFDGIALLPNLEQKDPRHRARKLKRAVGIYFSGGKIIVFMHPAYSQIRSTIPALTELISPHDYQPLQ